MRHSLNVAAALEAISRLTPDEVKIIRRELTKKPNGGKPDTAGAEPDWLLEGMLNELRRQGIAPGACGWVPSELPKSYPELSPAVKETLLKRVGRPLSYPEKLSLGELVAQCLIQYWPPNSRVSFRQLTQSMGSALAAIDYCFPGYTKSNCLGHVISLKRMNGKDEGESE